MKLIRALRFVFWVIRDKKRHAWRRAFREGWDGQPYLFGPGAKVYSAQTDIEGL
jgi:hypothetical protein